ncbi:LacI family DNA-binding transcriptional regulator [Microbacterium gorillae]|uniref:LacI family DNA-binding transcriptional regulator n=1 Tax=Microbacterium gorillae TaxID=1231063 RepID=UPI003D9A0140
MSKVIRGAYGVSPGMQARVEAAIAELGYRPRASARAMRGASFTIGVESPALLGTDFLPTIIFGAAQALSRAGYDLISLPVLSVWDSANALERLIDRPVDGVISLGTIVSSEDLTAMAAGVPIVAIGRHERSDAFDTVCSDDEAGATLAMTHLHDLGHRNIAHVTLALPGSLDTAFDGHDVRARAYEAYMTNAGLKPTVVRVDPERPREGIAEFFNSQTHATAVFAANDGLALDVLAVLREGNATRESVSVIGYDGAPITAHPLIGLTTMDQNGVHLGSTAATVLLERLKGRDTPVHHRTTPTIRPGLTTFAPA